MLNDTVIDSYEKFARGLLKESQVPGVAVGLSKDGQRVYEKGFGFRNAEEQLEVTMDTVFGIASLTKSFTCMAILQLQEAGKLSIHNPVVDYLPEFRLRNSNAAKQMTIHHFMTHTSGIPAMPYMSDSMVRAINEDLTEEQKVLPVMSSDEEPVTYIELMNKIAQLDIELLDSPGTIFSYNNECFSLLGAIVERVSGVPYNIYIKENILNPVGMNNTGILDEDFIENKNMTQPYVTINQDGAKDILASPNWWASPAMHGTASLRSTVHDLLLYTEIFRTGGQKGTKQILNSNSIKLMLTPYVLTNMTPNQYYGYGLMLTEESDGSTLIQHNGNAKGVTSLLQINPEKGLAAIGLSNLQMAPVFGLTDGLMNVAQNRSPEYSRIGDDVYHVSDEDLNEYVGIYNSDDRGPATFKVVGNQVTLTSYGMTYTLEGLEKDLFRIKGGRTDDTVPFFRDEDNKVTRLSFAGRIHIKE